VFGKFLCQLLPIAANKKRKNTPSMDETHSSENCRHIGASTLKVSVLMTLNSFYDSEQHR